MFNWQSQPPAPEPKTPRELFLKRLREGVPYDLACRAAGYDQTTMRDDPEVDKALAEGEILLFNRAAESGVTGTIRAAMRHEAKSWQAKAEPNTGKTLEDYLRE